VYELEMLFPGGKKKNGSHNLNVNLMLSTTSP